MHIRSSIGTGAWKVPQAELCDLHQGVEPPSCAPSAEPPGPYEPRYPVPTPHLTCHAHVEDGELESELLSTGHQQHTVQQQDLGMRQATHLPSSDIWPECP